MASARGQAVERGPLGKALHEFARRGLVDIAKDRRQAINRLVASYIKADLRDVTDRLALASKNADVASINRKIQQARRQAGCLGNSASVNGELLFENDRVLFRKNSRVIGVKNGSFGTLVGFDERFQVAFVRLDGDRRTKTPGKVVRVDLREYKDLTLGYCSSVFRAQGVTQDNVFVLGDQLDKEAGYVALTRSAPQDDDFPVEGGRRRKACFRHQVTQNRQRQNAGDHAFARSTNLDPEENSVNSFGDGSWPANRSNDYDATTRA